MNEPKDLTIIQLAALGAYQVFCSSHVCTACPLDEAIEEGTPPEICPSYVIDHPHEVLRAFGVYPDFITDASGDVTGIHTDQIPAGDIATQPESKGDPICEIEDMDTALRQLERWEKDACYERGLAKGLFTALWLAYKSQSPEKEG